MKVLLARNKKAIIIVFLCLLMLSVFFLGLEQAAGKENEQIADRVIIYMIDKLSIDDLDPHSTPYLWSLADKASMGLLNPVSAGERTLKNICCTISAGKPAVGSSKAQLNFKAGELINSETAATVFFRNTAVLAESENIVISSKAVIFKNNERRALGTPGQLGDSLHQLSCTTAVIGDSDRPAYYSRPGALILMDSQGLVDDGSLGAEVLTFDKDGVLPFQSNYSQILTQSKKLRDHQVILIDFGDLSRLEAMDSLFSTYIYDEKRKKILSNIDNCIRNIQNELATENSCAYIINPASSGGSVAQDNLLTPLIIVKPGFHGILSSSSTHREGIVSSISIKDSILSCFDNIKQDPIFASASHDTYKKLQNLEQRATFNYLKQKLILSVHGMLVLFLLLFSLILFIRKEQQNFISFILVLTLSFPLTLLFMTRFEIFDPGLFIVISLISNMLIALASWITSKVLKSNPLLMVLLLTIAVVAIDLLADTGLINNSIMSYQIIRGARYYGLGNEYLGVLLGATIIAAALILQDHFSRKRLFSVAVLFTLVTFLIAYPRLGINVGGTITACVALGYTFSRFKNLNMNTGRILSLFLGTAIIMFIMIIIDLKQPLQFQSHLGNSISLMLDGSYREIITILNRKFQMHLQIISFTIWGWVFLLSIVLCGFLFFQPPEKVKMLMAKFPLAYKGFQGILVASLTAIIFNDSGITTAAILSIYFLVGLLNSLCEQGRSSSNQLFHGT